MCVGCWVRACERGHGAASCMENCVCAAGARRGGFGMGERMVWSVDALRLLDVLRVRIERSISEAFYLPASSPSLECNPSPSQAPRDYGLSSAGPNLPAPSLRSRTDSADISTRNVGPEAMALLKATSFELIVNPEDAEPSRSWVLEKIADPEVIAACIMHGQPSDKVDAELLGAASKNLKVISTFSVGFGECEARSAEWRRRRLGMGSWQERGWREGE